MGLTQPQFYVDPASGGIRDNGPGDLEGGPKREAFCRLGLTHLSLFYAKLEFGTASGNCSRVDFRRRTSRRLA